MNNYIKGKMDYIKNKADYLIDKSADNETLSNILSVLKELEDKAEKAKKKQETETKFCYFIYNTITKTVYPFLSEKYHTASRTFKNYVKHYPDLNPYDFELLCLSIDFNNVIPKLLDEKEKTSSIFPLIKLDDVSISICNIKYNDLQSRNSYLIEDFFSNGKKSRE